MIDFPIGALVDDEACLAWLEQYLHSQGLVCQWCASADRRLFRMNGPWPACRCHWLGCAVPPIAR
jgi:hypothetical protein